jgi:3',5'-cyclic AMP phosphodiesterase CpdA
MLRILHVSDLHFGPPFLPQVDEALVRIAPTLNPDVAVISGDLTQRARADQFIAAREFIARLPDVPKVIVPGNHDVPLYRIGERLVNPHKLYREHISNDLDQVWRVNGAVIVALDSTSPRRAISNGRIHQDQLEFCTRSFEAAPEDVAKIIVAHHHFAPAPDYVHDEVMPKAKRAVNRFVDLGVDLILGGHLHRAYIGNTLDIYPGNHRDRGIIIVQCGTTTSRRGRAREREKNSFNMIMLGQQVVHITHYMYFDEADGFEPISRHFFPRPGHHKLTDHA